MDDQILFELASYLPDCEVKKLSRQALEFKPIKVRAMKLGITLLAVAAISFSAMQNEAIASSVRQLYSLITGMGVVNNVDERVTVLKQPLDVTVRGVEFSIVSGVKTDSSVKLRIQFKKPYNLYATATLKIEGQTTRAAPRRIAVQNAYEYDFSIRKTEQEYAIFTIANASFSLSFVPPDSVDQLSKLGDTATVNGICVIVSPKSANSFSVNYYVEDARGRAWTKDNFTPILAYALDAHGNQYALAYHSDAHLFTLDAPNVKPVKIVIPTMKTTIRQMVHFTAPLGGLFQSQTITVGGYSMKCLSIQKIQEKDGSWTAKISLRRDFNKPYISGFIYRTDSGSTEKGEWWDFQPDKEFGDPICVDVPISASQESVSIDFDDFVCSAPGKWVIELTGN